MKRLVVIGAVIAVAGGGFFLYQQQQAAEDERRRDVREARLAEAEREEREQEMRAYRDELSDYREAERCRDSVGGFVRATRDLESRISVGVVFQDYNNYVGDLASAYDRIRQGRLTTYCVTQVVEPSRKTLNAHIDATSTWDDCIQSLSCGDVEPRLRDHWDVAGRHFRDLLAGLREVKVTKPERPT